MVHRKTPQRNAKGRRNITERKKTSLKTPKIKPINFRAAKPTSDVASNRPSTSGRRTSKKPMIQPMRYDVTAINIPPEERRPVIIDAENVAFDHLVNNFNANRIRSAIQYFTGIGHRVVCLCPDYLEDKMSSIARHVEYVPNCSGDPEKNYNLEIAMLQRANEEQAAIVSERFFLSTYHEFYHIVTERVIGYTMFRNVIFIPVDPYGRAGPWLREILRKPAL